MLELNKIYPITAIYAGDTITKLLILSAMDLDSEDNQMLYGCKSSLDNNPDFIFSPRSEDISTEVINPIRGTVM